MPTLSGLTSNLDLVARTLPHLSLDVPIEKSSLTSLELVTLMLILEEECRISLPAFFWKKSVKDLMNENETKR